MVQLYKLSKNAIEKIKSYRYDRIIEKHEGPEPWDSVLKYDQPEFIAIAGKPVVLPVDQVHRK